MPARPLRASGRCCPCGALTENGCVLCRKCRGRARWERRAACRGRKATRRRTTARRRARQQRGGRRP